MDTVPTDVLKLILSKFEGNCNSFILRQVCKTWKNIVKKTKRYNIFSIIDYNAPYLSVLRWLYKSHPLCFMESNLIVAAAKSGQLETLQWAFTIGLDLYEDVFDAAAESGNIKMLDWLRDKCHWGSSIWISAARGGHIDVLLWLQQEKIFGVFSRVLCNEVAIKSHNFEMFKFIYESKNKSQNLLKVAITEQQWEIVDLLLKDGVTITHEHCTLICRSGNFTLLLQAHASGAQLNSDCLAEAICSGNMEMVQWLRSMNVPWAHTSAIAAAKIGDLELLKRVHQEGCPLESGIITKAIRRNDMEMIQWCLDNGVHISPLAADVCAESGNIELMDFLWKNFRTELKTASLFTSAVRGGHLKMLQWAKNHYISWDKSIGAVAAQCGSVEVLEWLNKNGFFRDGYAYNVLGEAIENEHLLAVKWLDEHGAPMAYFPYRAMYKGNVSILKYLHAKKRLSLKKEILHASFSYHPHAVRWVQAQLEDVYKDTI